jgi:hypothetical protein
MNTDYEEIEWVSSIVEAREVTDRRAYPQEPVFGDRRKTWGTAAEVAVYDATVAYTGTSIGRQQS